MSETRSTPAPIALVKGGLSEPVRRLCGLSDAELATRDIAELNLLVARGLPGAERLDIDACLEKLGNWAKLVRLMTERWWPKFVQAPDEYERSPGKFLMLCLVTVFQRDLGVRYNFPFSEGEYDGTDSRNLFLHGLLSGHGGTCVTMPILYVAMGRRLGYPLKLVRAKEHTFVRWEEPGGERFNIEATSEGFCPHDDAYYHERPRPLTDEDLATGFYLRSLAPREEVADFLANRGTCLTEHLLTHPALEAFYFADRLCRDCPPHLGAVADLAACDADRDVTAIAHHPIYSAFKALTSQANAAAECLFGFTGRPLEAATGVQNNRNRWHDPTVGRWISEDPIGFCGEDKNEYRYVSNRVTSQRDPGGLQYRGPGGIEHPDAGPDSRPTAPAPQKDQTSINEGEEHFRDAARKNGVPEKLIDIIIKAANGAPRPWGAMPGVEHHKCEDWVDNFKDNFWREMRAAGYKTAGMERESGGGIVSTKIQIFKVPAGATGNTGFGAVTQDHTAFYIAFKDKSAFYVDLGILSAVDINNLHFLKSG